MSRRCHHEYETKNGYPDDLICQQCQTISTLADSLYQVLKDNKMNWEG